MAIETVVDRAMRESELEPARWSQSFSEKDLGKAKIDALGGVVPVLREYAAAAESLPFRKKVAALLSRSGDCYWHVHGVRSPTKLLFAHNRSVTVAFLAGCVPIAHDPDSNANMIACTTSGRVASFLFDDVAPNDAKPRDFRTEGASLTDVLTQSGKRADTSDVERRYRRAVWIARFVHHPDDVNDYDGDDELDRIALNAKHAATLSDYAKERRRLAAEPALATYWLLSHALLGMRSELEETLAGTTDIEHPAVVDLRKKLAPITRGVAVFEGLFEEKRVDWDADHGRKVLAGIAKRVRS